MDIKTKLDIAKQKVKGIAQQVKGEAEVISGQQVKGNIDIVNSPTPANESGGSSFLIGVIVLIGFVLLLLYYGLPAIKNMNVQAPQVNIPNKIDVNVKQTK